MDPTSTVLSQACHVHDTPAVSLYLHATPGDRSGERHRLAGLITQAERSLEAKRERAPGATALMDALRDTTGSDTFLASRVDRVVFAAPAFVRWHELAHPIDDRVVVGDRLFIRPLLAEAAATRFLVLALHQDRVRVFACDAAAIAPVALHLPSMHEAQSADLLRDDVPDTPVEPHAGRDDERTIRAYFRLVASTLHVARLPGWDHVLLAGTDRNRGLFRAAAGPLVVLDRDIAGDPDGVGDEEFSRRALETVRDANGDAFAVIIDRLRRGDHHRPVQRETSAILEAAAAGEIDCLLIARGAHAWGRPGAAGGVEDHHGEQATGDEDLLNLAAIDVVRNGGVAYEVDPARLDPGDHAVAFLRWCAEHYGAVPIA